MKKTYQSPELDVMELAVEPLLVPSIIDDDATEPGMARDFDELIDIFEE